jgi:hypothetical protein
MRVARTPPHSGICFFDTSGRCHFRRVDHLNSLWRRRV